MRQADSENNQQYSQSDTGDAYSGARRTVSEQVHPPPGYSLVWSGQYENMLRVRQAGAVVLFLAPGFYAGARSVDDLVDFVVGRCLDQLGLEHELVRRWGQE